MGCVIKLLVDGLAKGIIDLLRKLDVDVDVADFLVGVKYSYVEVYGVKGRSLGVAITPLEDIVGLAQADVEKPSLENLSSLVASINPVEKALGIAFVNALSNYLLWNLRYVEGFDLIEVKSFIEALPSFAEEPIVVIGNMPPLVAKLQQAGFSDIAVLERNPLARRNCYPDTAAPRIIPKARTLIITGATLVNDTIDYILQLNEKAKKIIVGPTANSYPKLLLNGGIDIVASIAPVDVEKVKAVIKLGGGRWVFYKHCREYVAHSLTR
ncbi:MAG: hypothetical protein DRJ31_10600 [Candidatus Methanomethylicota archaeon]|uniref:Heavy-metal chelation domain-containing protein n=1 Tax=Thermoproteota archaeon TaxID=2056631 RepID=A0A497ELZ1_9CREN|nr:MAG: hypothetical protein DRJ31_10600 [Candidatus Verstraetearchaeota archaeon]